MLEYLEDSLDLNQPHVASLLDELSLWSAPFGLMLLDQVKLRPGMRVLDVGFGIGFPVIELAQRLGNSSTVYGIDPWTAGIERTQDKIKTFNIKNVKIVEGDAASMNFKDNMFHLIVSNLGINNFADVAAVFRECSRVAKPKAQIALTTNPEGHMKEFYHVLTETVIQLKLDHLLDKLEAQQKHRLSVKKVCHLLETAGFTICQTQQKSFSMRFLNGTAFLNHYFIKCAFMDGWKSIFPTDRLNPVFTRLEKNLNALAKKKKEFKVTVPIAYIEGEKP
ncbi:MAG: methyltransferase domain-containing protein [Candidatus Aminicenantes bacterium]|nr:MAG: methyltransferase domain-containing protein [Candidatus Aminicenantes bacterium]